MIEIGPNLFDLLQITVGAIVFIVVTWIILD